MNRLRIVSIFFLLMIPVIPSKAFAFGAEIAAGAWLQSPSGKLAYEPIGVDDVIDIGNDLKYDDETGFMGRIKVDMPLFIPNIYVMGAAVQFEGNGSKNVNFKFGDKTFNANIPFYSSTRLDHLDIALYYSVPLLKTASFNKLNIELGLNLRLIDLEVEFNQAATGIEQKESLTVPVPMGYAAVQFKPLEWLALEAESRGLVISNDAVYSLLGRVRCNVYGPLFVAAGYRYDKFDFDEDDVFINADISGPFAEVGFAF